MRIKVQRKDNLPCRIGDTQNMRYRLRPAVVVVSAAVISMPYWQKTRDDGVIIEEQVSTPTPSDMSESVVSNTADTSYPYPTG